MNEMIQYLKCNGFQPDAILKQRRFIKNVCSGGIITVTCFKDINTLKNDDKEWKIHCELYDTCSFADIKKIQYDISFTDIVDNLECYESMLVYYYQGAKQFATKMFNYRFKADNRNWSRRLDNGYVYIQVFTKAYISESLNDIIIRVSFSKDKYFGWMNAYRVEKFTLKEFNELDLSYYLDCYSKIDKSISETRTATFQTFGDALS